MLPKNPFYQLLGVVAGIIILCPIVYSLSLKKSFQLLDEISEGENEIAKYERISNEKFKDLEVREIELNKIIASTNEDSANYQQKLANYLLLEAEKRNLKITQIPTTEVNQIDGYNFENASFTLEGGFLNMVAALQRIEANCPVGKVVSINYKKIQNRKTKVNKLYGTIYIQKITS